ncbi:nicotinate-nucleotide-dimethylbenzimidazole phosphoribosyltransferase [Ectothiorhodospira magna]|uniref:Nicotinate-nucleotide--dimethylbenzimidazole phosphoribosyltransferase n=1 Tax=Ectothiorhodospira magna TaxID=867345 RepID=A0A1H9DE27_9GAMM|nr:nicotinate-nucleotide--dimethylbenzimidazole phosphoribosyltransferase [Ectothiorhodospira magna]SEQ11083.1 nicotinate-nucleotide-dimethylbenzimidazole phosphoribosyltransferase [Ectothiorhodospira magna]
MNHETPWLQVPAAPIDDAARRAAEDRQTQLTKPLGSLGRLETLATRLAGMQGTDKPRVDQVQISIFAGDHGVAAEGISRFPQSVTAEMVRNFARGGAGISVLARAIGATLEVINLGTVMELEPMSGVLDVRLGPGTANFVKGPAMDAHQLAKAMNAGRHSAERARLAGAQLYLAGEMGIGNTTAAAAISCGLLGRDPEVLAGPGTGLDPAGVQHKAQVLRRALTLHGSENLSDPVECLRRVGGFEIAAMSGAYLACAQMGMPILVDGFISSAAALATVRICPGARDWMLFAHASAEPGHRLLVEALAADPVLDLGMRLGEASGAATAVPLLRLACDIHCHMATFAEAQVAEAH